MEELEEFAGKLFDMARAGNSSLIDYVNNGVNVNLVNQNGDSFLMLAAYNGHADLVRQLIDAGADVNLLNDRGQAPIAGALFKKEAEVITVLRESGADLDAGSPSARAIATMFGVEL